jgi:SAM-dependent methyltransferase
MEQPLDLFHKFRGLPDVQKLTILDIGCGRENSPLSSQMRSIPFKKLTGFDTFAPGIKELLTTTIAAKEKEFLVRDAITYLPELPDQSFDVVILMDVVEHFDKATGLWLISEAIRLAKQRILIWIPIGNAPQGALEGNPDQVHEATWTVDELQAQDFTVHLYQAFHQHFDPPVDAAWAILDKKKVEKILVERLDVNGDVLVATSVLKGLQEKYPKAVIDWHVRSGFDFALQNNPRIRAIIQGPVVDMPALHKRYDLIIRPDHHMCWRTQMARVHCMQADVDFNPPELYLADSELAAVPPEHKNRILVAVKAGWYSRQCTNFNKVLVKIAPEHPDLLQVDNGPSLSGISHFTGTLRQVAAIMQFAKLYIGIDTVFMHMAVALGIPMVLVLGPTGPETQYIPRSVFIRPFVNLNPVEPREEYRLGIQLTEEEILNTIRKVLQPDGTIVVQENSV